MSALLRLLRHDLRLQARQAGEWAALLLFFLIVVILLPFALGPEPELLSRLAPGLIWLAALLMSLLSLEKLFVQDARDGTLDVMLLATQPLPLIIFARLAAQSLAILLAVSIMLPVAAVLLDMKFNVLPIMLFSLLLGIPSLVMLGGIASAITVALRRNPALLTLLLVPFYIPVMIFAVAACDAASIGALPVPPLLLMGAILAVVMPAAPYIIAAALRNGQD